MGHADVNDLHVALRKRLSEPGYARRYASESAFEADVWRRLFNFTSAMSEKGPHTAKSCLSSHTTLQSRSDAAWKEFCREERGPDVKVLGSNNRLDIVVKHPVKGSIRIEVKCLGNGGHAAKLTQGLGQAMLALAHRDRTLLVADQSQPGAAAADVRGGPRSSRLGLAERSGRVVGDVEPARGSA